MQCLYNISRKVRDEVDFFDADKHQSFLTVDFNTLGIKVFYDVTDMIVKKPSSKKREGHVDGNDQAFLKYSK